MAVGAMCMALSSVLSLIKLWPMPMGGSVTPASMLPLLLFAYCYGVGPGMVLGALYGVMQFLLDGMAWAALGAIPNLLDYPIAFGLLGLAGCFRGSKAKMTAGFVLGCFGRFMASFLSGFIFYDLQRQLHARRVHHLHRAGAAGRGAAGEGTQESRMTNFPRKMFRGIFSCADSAGFCPSSGEINRWKTNGEANTDD